MSMPRSQDPLTHQFPGATASAGGEKNGLKEALINSYLSLRAQSTSRGLEIAAK